MGRWIPAGVLSQQGARRSERHRRPRRQARSRSDGGATGRFYQKAAASSSRLPSSAEAEPPHPLPPAEGFGVGTQHGLCSAPSAVFRRCPLGLNTGSTEMMCSLPPALQLGLSHGAAVGARGVPEGLRWPSPSPQLSARRHRLPHLHPLSPAAEPRQPGEHGRPFPFLTRWATLINDD